MQGNPLGYSIAFLAENGPISRAEIYRALGQGSLKAKKIGRRTIVPHEAWNEFLASMPDYTQAAA